MMSRFKQILSSVKRLFSCMDKLITLVSSALLPKTTKESHISRCQHATHTVPFHFVTCAMDHVVKTIDNIDTWLRVYITCVKSSRLSSSLIAYWGWVKGHATINT